MTFGQIDGDYFEKKDFIKIPYTINLEMKFVTVGNIAESLRNLPEMFFRVCRLIKKIIGQVDYDQKR